MDHDVTVQQLKSLSDLSLLFEAVKSVLEFKSFPEIAKKIFLQAKTLIGATAGYVALLSKDGRENDVLFLDAGGVECTVDPSLPMPIRGLRSEAYKSNEPVFDNDFAHSKWINFLPKGHAPLRNVLFAPLVLNGRAVGLLGLANKPSDFTEHDKFIASSLGNFACLALLNSRNLDSQKSLIESNEKALRQNQITQNFLKIANEPHTLKSLLPTFLRELQSVTKCGSVGIRLVYKGGSIPFQAHIGFPTRFLELESPLSVQTHNCLCSRVIRKEVETIKAFCTQHGSFFANNLSYDLGKLSKEALLGLRKNCCQFGYSSLALIPIIFGEEVLRLFYMADVHENMIPPDLVTLIENIGLHLGPAIKRLQIEDHLREESQELERSNKELEQFAFAASHDLQEPLRMVSMFLGMLVHSGDLDAERRSFVQRAVDGAKHMRRMISDLLDYSRIQSRGIAFKLVNLNDVFNEVLINLGLKISDTGAIVTNDALPTVMGDYMQLTRLFQNLIGNAIKFKKESEIPRIYVGSMADQSPFIHIIVRDNGIGIDPKYFHKIFTIFHRLHGADKYPGTGIGLAECRKIIERHGGRIWVESSPNIGSTFHFTIQNQDNENLVKT